MVRWAAGRPFFLAGQTTATAENPRALIAGYGLPRGHKRGAGRRRRAGAARESARRTCRQGSAGGPSWTTVAAGYVRITSRDSASPARVSDDRAIGSRYRARVIEAGSCGRSGRAAPRLPRAAQEAIGVRQNAQHLIANASTERAARTSRSGDRGASVGDDELAAAVQCRTGPKVGPARARTETARQKRRSSRPGRRSKSEPKRSTRPNRSIVAVPRQQVARAAHPDEKLLVLAGCSRRTPWAT